MYILGISCFYHDGAACLLRDGEIVAAAEEERFTRLKHDSSFPIHAVNYCLQEAGITPRELDRVVFYEKPLLKFERILSSYIDTFPASQTAFVRALNLWLGEKLWVRGLVKDRVRGYRGRISFSEHHLSHAASAFLVSPFDEAAVLTADGVGEWTTTAAGVGQGTDLQLVKEIRFPHSIGLLYSAFTAYLGFEVNEGEYKVMGMAAYGRPRYTDLVRRVVDVASDGSYQLNLMYFDHHRALRAFSRALEELLGPPRDPNAELDQRFADLAASVQSVVEDIMVRLASDLRRVTGLRSLCMAGGVALNGLANARILREAGFDHVFVQPAAGDSGGAIGAAAYLYHTVLGQPRTAPMRHAYLGPSFRDEQIAEFLDHHQIPAARLSDQEIVTSVADRLARGEVVGWFRGRMEFGPRALGCRSILADPRSSGMKDVVNEKIKHREAFRPFAPAVPLDDAPRYFELECESPYMLLIVPVREEQRRAIPAVTHEDGTARVQTVRRDDNASFYDLIKEFDRRAGVPVVLNTSFNVRGEPIVCTPAQAFNDFAYTDLDYLVLGNYGVAADAKKLLFPYPGRTRTKDTMELAI